MGNRSFFAQANRALAADGNPVPFARAYFYSNRTTTLVPVYSDPDFASERSQPVLADSAGIFPAVYVAGSAPIRVLLADAQNVSLAGYPIDDVPASGFGTTASEMPFLPTEALPYTNVQTAVEGAAGIAADQTSVAQRALTQWSTGGTGDAYTISPSPAITGYGSWQSFKIRPDRANTGASTIDVNGLGTRNIRKVNSSGTVVDVAAGDIRAHVPLTIDYDGTQFVIGEDIADYVLVAGDAMTGPLVMQHASAPTVKYYNTAGGTDLKRWHIYTDTSGTLYVFPRADDDTAAGTGLRVQRDASGITSIRCAMSAAMSSGDDIVNKTRGDAAYARQTLSDIGSIGLLKNKSGAGIVEGNSTIGSNLRYSGADGSLESSTGPAGTWMALSRPANNESGLFIRIS